MSTMRCNIVGRLIAVKCTYHIWDRSASDYIWRDIAWALNFTTLDWFNCRGTFRGQEKHDKESLSTGK